jgi:hypothetical protein
LDDLKFGLSRDALEESLNARGENQFSAAIDGHIYQCAWYDIVPDNYCYYFLFRDDGLVSIVRTWPPFLYEDIDGVEEKLLWDAERAMTEVIEAPGLTIGEFQEYAESLREQRADRGPIEMSGIWPIAAVFVPISIAIAPVAGLVELRDASWENRFDSERIHLGMSRSGIEGKYGDPVFQLIEDPKLTLAFGPASSLRDRGDGLQFSWALRKSWVSVVLEEGVVTRIYTNDFFNTSQLLRREHARDPSQMPAKK